MEFKTDFSAVLSTPVFQHVKAAAAELDVATYVVGGFVRDHLLDRKTTLTDFDFVTVGSGIDLAKAVQARLPNNPKLSIFKNYGTAMIKFEGIDLEFVGARKESYSQDSRNPQVEKGSLQDDQNRRDFTISAMAVSLNQEDYGTLIDPFNGLSDLDHKLIRTPLDPVITYSDDPLRMLRAIRFATQLDFSIESTSLDAIFQERERMKIITQGRIV